MAPANNDRQSGHTGTIPKTKVRNNCNVPQEAVTPTRRDMTTNLGTTSLDWVPVSEYNSRSNYNQSRKPSNNTSDHELTDLDNSVSFESGFGRFVPVRPQPRALPLNVQNREGIASEQNDDVASSSMSGHTLHPYAHQMQNGLIPHTNHAAAAVMIVNPTTPNAVTGNMSQPFNAPNQNRNNLSRNLNSARNNFEGNSHTSNNNTTPPITNSRSGTKTVNIMNNMYDQGQGSFNNLNEPNHVHRESARALGEAIVAACPDAAAVERRLGQIREYIRVTSSLVDTMRNSEDEAFIEHTKEEYDELVQMVMTLKESETKLENMLLEKKPDNIEVPAEEIINVDSQAEITNVILEKKCETNGEKNQHQDIVPTTTKNNNDNSLNSSHLKKVTNIENEQLNKTLHSINNVDETTIEITEIETNPISLVNECNNLENINNNDITKSNDDLKSKFEIEEIESIPCSEAEANKGDQHLKEVLRKNIISCVEKVALIEEMKNKSRDCNSSNSNHDVQDIVTRPVSVQSNGSIYSDNELWQNEIKSKMELSQIRLAALKQQQKRLLKCQEEAKQQLEEMNRERQSQELHPSTSHENFSVLQNQNFSGNYHHPNRMYAANQIGVATTLPHSAEVLHGQINNIDGEHGHTTHSTHSQDERFSNREAIASSEEAMGGGRDSEAEDDEGLLNERSRLLQMKLRELQMKKQHMENLVSEFQKLQMATRLASSHNTYSSSGEDSGDDEPSRNVKCNKSGNNIKNEDPFKLMEIKAIKTALQKTKDLMRSVENYEAENLSSAHDDSFQLANHSNIHDNKSEGGGSMGGWSNDGSMCRVRNSLQQRHKFTNEQHSQQQHQHQQQPQQSHEANIASLQELAQELRMETKKIIGERARIKDMISNKEVSRKHKKVNEEAVAGPSGASGGNVVNGASGGGGGAPGPAERRQLQLRVLLADKQRELEALLNKEKVLSSECQKLKPDSRTASIVNQSYNSEQEDPDSRSEQILLDSQNSRENENYRACSQGGSGDNAVGGRSVNTLPSHLGSTYGSDSDSASRNKSNQRNRTRRRQPQDRQSDDNGTQSNNSNQNLRHETRAEVSNVNMVPPVAQNLDNPANMPYPHLPPPCWNSSKSNQDMRTNQFTQNSHSQTMDRLLGTPQMSYPPSMPFNMMMPYGMVGGCGCGCGFWGAWCWQQLVMQQREIHQLREQLNHLEERWRAETVSHTLNNQVPPGNRANNYWDNFRSYSRQNLLSANSKTNADGHLAVGPAHNPHPLVERSHNTLHHTSSSTSPSITPKRNTNTSASTQNAPTQSLQANNEDIPNRHVRRNMAYERSLSFSSAPDVLNVNQNIDADASSTPQSRNVDEGNNSVNVNINRQESTSNPFRSLNITSPIPEIIQAHSNNLNTTTNSKKKSSSKLPAKNSTNRRNYTLDYSQTSNINIASTSETPNPNLASTSREVHDKATSKLFDLLRENVYSEVTALIGVNESHPDFLIQLFRELQLISSDPLRQKVLQSIRNVLSQYSSIIDNHSNENSHHETRPEEVTTTTEPSNYHECNSMPTQNVCTSTMQLDNKVARFLLLKSEEICTTELLESLASHILSGDSRYTQQSKKRLFEILSKYEGMRLCNISSDIYQIMENLPLLFPSNNDGDEPSQHSGGRSEPSILQDVAGSLNLFSSSDTQLHQINSCPYDMWPGHVHMDIDGTDLNDNSPRSSQEGKVDLINCSEMNNGDLAEADQTCHSEVVDNGSNGQDEMEANAEALPDVVDTEEVTPTEAEAEWLGLDRVPTRLHMEESSEKQKGDISVLKT
ncbi:pericentriolar material 1 protein isoform X3 [Galleria mellonella]|uniref:Pericentriolar material 1 protein isoform X3 n=1 Tax=Galleria mellonella TaxID=7137 RepID=A0A6J3BU88_GALME|nr:pericentriolar material 1 protein isoform X3 [Galleria mellonella]